MNKNRITIASLLMAMLIVSMAFVPVVSAKAASQDSRDFVETIGVSNKISEEDIKKISENMNILKETDSEKIVSFIQDDGSIGYIILWTDEINSKRTYFAFVDQDELVSYEYLSVASLNDTDTIAAALSVNRESFANGSYVEQYGNSITGGLHIYFSPKDADLLADGSATIAGALAAALGLYLSGGLLSIALGALVSFAVQTWYWYEQNSDGSLDVKVPYANLGTVLLGTVVMKVGDHWYTISN